MRCRGVLIFSALTAVALLTWQIKNSFLDIHEGVRVMFVSSRGTQIQTRTSAPSGSCDLSISCPADHYSVQIRSGMANVLGPRICFDGKIIMSHAMNNIGPGLNIVVVNGENGAVEKLGYLDMINGVEADILEYLQAIQPGKIVLVASFDDVTPKMTDEMRRVLAGMGSSLINSVQQRDSWVFAGQAGVDKMSPFEMQVANNAKANAFEGWPEAVEVTGCFPKNVQPADGQMVTVEN
ncbi:protein FAM3C-like [Thalassophryne amazonica]|uniref:protein FAM3C-like n=1 Tax=Thalassophryne amazonica TaxID=390379 RepID=UPI001470E16E|nr:protein FAM3C-like [Thalassophryne amazonica]